NPLMLPDPEPFRTVKSRRATPSLSPPAEADVITVPATTTRALLGASSGRGKSKVPEVLNSVEFLLVGTETVPEVRSPKSVTSILRPERSNTFEDNTSNWPPTDRPKLSTDEEYRSTDLPN